MKHLLLIILAACSIFAQSVAMTQTTLVLPMDGNQRNLNVADATGITGPGLFGQTRTYLYVDKELMSVQSVVGTGVVVQRGVNGTVATPHNASAVVYVGPGNQFSSSTPTGACTDADWPVTPRIVPTTGGSYTCTSGVWTLVGSGGGGGSYVIGNGLVQTGDTLSVDTTTIVDFGALQAGAALSCRPASASGSAYTCNTSPLWSPVPWTTGSRIAFRSDVACSAAATLAINGGTAAALRRADGTAVSAGDCAAGITYTADYDGTGWRLQGVPVASSLGSTEIVINDQFCNWMNFPATQPNGWRLYTTNSTNPTASSQASPTQSPSLCGVTLTSSGVINDEIIFNPYSRQPYINPTTMANWDVVSWPLVLKTSIDNKEVSIGYINSAGGTCYTSGNNCFGFTYRAGTDTNWRFITISGFTVTNQDTGVAVAADTLYNFRLWATTAGTILGSINGGTTLTVSTNIANVAMYPQIYVKNLTAAAHAIYTPHFQFRATGTGF